MIIYLKAWCPEHTQGPFINHQYNAWRWIVERFDSLGMYMYDKLLTVPFWYYFQWNGYSTSRLGATTPYSASSHHVCSSEASPNWKWRPLALPLHNIRMSCLCLIMVNFVSWCRWLMTDMKCKSEMEQRNHWWMTHKGGDTSAKVGVLINIHIIFIRSITCFYVTTPVLVTIGCGWGTNLNLSIR